MDSVTHPGPMLGIGLFVMIMVILAGAIWGLYRFGRIIFADEPSDEKSAR